MDRGAGAARLGVRVHPVRPRGASARRGAPARRHAGCVIARRRAGRVSGRAAVQRRRPGARRAALLRRDRRRDARRGRPAATPAARSAGARRRRARSRAPHPDGPAAFAAGSASPPRSASRSPPCSSRRAASAATSTTAFMLDDDKLFFVVADVSGKGLAASLFMALSKALLKSIALRRGDDPAWILARASKEINRDNRESLFVTALAGVLDARTGRLVVCNAGHEPAVVCRAGGAPERSNDPGGPPLCVIRDFTLRKRRAHARAGRMVLRDYRRRHRGDERARASSTAEPASCRRWARLQSASPDAVIAALNDDVRRFAGRRGAIRRHHPALRAAGTAPPETALADVDLDAPVAAARRRCRRSARSARACRGRRSGCARRQCRCRSGSPSPSRRAAPRAGRCPSARRRCRCGR